MQIDLQPFQTPDCVVQKMASRPKQDGFVIAPSYRLHELDATTLAALCDQFRKEVFAKAGKADPTLTKL